MNIKMWLGGTAAMLVLLAGCGGGSSNNSTTVASSSSSVASVSGPDAFTQSVQGVRGTTSETASPMDISGIVPVFNDTAVAVAVY